MAVFLFTSLTFKNDFEVEILPSLTYAVLGWGPCKRIYYLWSISSKNGELPCICHITNPINKVEAELKNFTLDQMYLLMKVLSAILVNVFIPHTKTLQMPRSLFPMLDSASSLGLCAGTAFHVASGCGLERYHDGAKRCCTTLCLFSLGVGVNLDTFHNSQLSYKKQRLKATFPLLGLSISVNALLLGWFLATFVATTETVIFLVSVLNLYFKNLWKYWIW